MLLHYSSWLIGSLPEKWHRSLKFVGNNFLFFEPHWYDIVSCMTGTFCSFHLSVEILMKFNCFLII